MKRLRIFFIALALIVACQNDDLPNANFNLNAITVFNGEVAHEKVSLSWSAPSESPENYILTWSPDGETIELDTSVESFEVIGLKNGTTYEFSIQANYGDSGISGAAELKLQPLDELDFVVLPGSGLAIATWDTPNRQDITGYSLSWSPNGQTLEIPSDANVFQITNLENDVDYTFDFSIIYGDGKSSDKVQSIATPGEIEAFLVSEASPRSTQEVQFTYNPAILPQSTASSWSWNFGDETTSDLENPTHTYELPGEYEVTLAITDGQGLTFEYTSTLPVWGEKWSFTTGADIRSSSPAIGNDGTIYVGSRDNNLYAFNPNGTLKWTFAMENAIDASPSIAADGTIYCGSYDDRMYAINPDGSLKWSFLTGGNIRYTAPAIGSDGTVYFGSEDNKLYALNPDGTVKWEFVSGDRIRSTPALGMDGNVYVTSNDNNLYSIRQNDGGMNWSFNVGGFSEGGPSIDTDGTIFVGVDKGGSDGAVVAVNPDGSEKWNRSILGRISVNVPIVANGRIYIGTKEGENLLALDKSTGSQVWSFVVPGEIILSNPAVDVNGNIYFGAWNKGFYSITPEGELRYAYETGRVWSSPVIGTDGTVYFGSYDDKFYAMEMFAEGLANDVWPMFGKNLSHTSR